MSKEILNLEPIIVWKHFYSLTQIPRPSKKEAKAIEFLKDFGKRLNLETIVDYVGNIIIRKPATNGYEGRKGIILQAHIDMVPQKNSDTKHDFEKDPIDAYIDGEWVTARGTTLGADNGMGVAAALAVLESNDIEHGPVEVLFTVDEETGMTGANELKPNVLKGDILLNLDSEDEGELYIGCAGGIDGEFTFDYNEVSVEPNSTAFRIDIAGLKGGHSGMDIILGRGNSVKILTRLLSYAEQNFKLRLSHIDAGNMRNAIPREGYAIVTIHDNFKEDFVQYISKFNNIVKTELASVEPNLKVSITNVEMPKTLIDLDTQSRVINAVYGCPNGVIRMSNEMENLVETSTNLAILNSNDNKISVKCLLRSSVDTAKEDLVQMMGSVFKLAQAKVDFSGGYPGWKPNPSSEILNTMLSVYEKNYNKTPQIKAIHAGLECGLLGAVYPNWDMISFGPTIRYPHSPDEKVNIDSISKFWDYLKKILKNAPKKDIA